jgi:hypothetical protein
VRNPKATNGFVLSFAFILGKLLFRRIAEYIVAAKWVIGDYSRFHSDLGHSAHCLVLVSDGGAEGHVIPSKIGPIRFRFRPHVVHSFYIQCSCETMGSPHRSSTWTTFGSDKSARAHSTDYISISRLLAE